MMATTNDIDRMMKMPEAQKYLVDHGVPVKSRSSFYRLIEDPKHKSLLPFADLTPSSRYSNRRFRKKDLDKFLEVKGFKDSTLH